MPCIVSAAPPPRAGRPCATVNGEICLTHWNYWIAYDPNILNQVYDTEGVEASQCGGLNDCSWNVLSEGNWNADGVIGPEYEFQAAANGNYCLASTAYIDTEHSIGASSVIVVDYPSEYPTPSSNLESYTGGPVFGRWAIP